MPHSYFDPIADSARLCPDPALLAPSLLLLLYPARIGSLHHHQHLTTISGMERAAFMVNENQKIEVKEKCILLINAIENIIEDDG